MSKAIKTEHKVKHVETTRVHPDDVRVGRNSRMIAAPNYLDIITRLAVSIYKHGQLQPAEARRLEDNTLELVSGNTRLDAVKHLRDGFSAVDPDSGENVIFHVPEATLWVKIVDMDADTAFLHSIKENQDREDTTDLQEALAQNELRTTMGWTDTKIARFYGYSNQNRVMSLERLLRLPADVQTAVHEGRMALSIALLTLDLTDEDRAKTVEAATGEGGKVSGPALKQLIRGIMDKKASEEPAGDAEGDAEEPEKEPKGPSIKRSVKDLERFLATDAESESPELSTAGVEFLETLVLWFKGKRNDAYLTRTINEYMK